MLVGFKPQITITALALLTVAPRTASAHKGATGFVKQRMDAMKVMRTNLRAVAAMLEGKRTYDSPRARQAATTIRMHASQMPNLFPIGSTQHPGEAQPAIWSRWPEFEQSAKGFAVYANALAKVPGDPEPSKVKAILAMIGRTCSDCHKTFRKQKR